MIEVSCAIIRNEENDILVVQRGGKSDHPFKWEFPGGKLNSGESAEDSVIREVFEELGMPVVIIYPLQPVEHDYGTKQIRLLPFVCDTLMEKPVLHEHVAYRWVSADELNRIDFSEADVTVAASYKASGGTGTMASADAAGTATPDRPHQEPPVVTDEELTSMINGLAGAGEVEWIASSAAVNTTLFRKLLEFSEGADTRLVFRSSWVLTKVCEGNPSLFLPHLPVIVEMLLRTNNGSAERSFLKILQLSGTDSLDEKTIGKLVDHCFSLLRSRESAIAVKVYSMDVLVSIVQRFPDLTNELVAVLGLMPDDVPAGIISKRRSVLRKLSS